MNTRMEFTVWLCTSNLTSLGSTTCIGGVYIHIPGGSDSKESACNAGDLGSIPGLGRSPGGGHGKPLQYSYLENPMDRGAWPAKVHGIAKNQTRLSNYA